MTDVCILSTVHRRNDTRIFSREALSIATLPGVVVTIVLADGLGPGNYHGIPIIDVGSGKGRLERFTKTNIAAIGRVVDLHPDVLHFHDPEVLLTAAYIRRKTGCLTIYDAHEDLPKDILDKYWIPRLFRGPLSVGARHVEQSLAWRMDHVIAATPSIRNNFRGLSTTVVANYPSLSEFETPIAQPFESRKSIAYIGSMTRIRGVANLVAAMAHVQDRAVRLDLAGPAAPSTFLDKLTTLDGWSRTNYLGIVARDRVSEVLRGALAGIVPFLPAHNHMESQPNKLFEYMAAGVPVLASNFPLWTKLIDDVGCGLTFDSEDPTSIARAVDHLAAHPDEAEAMGRRGRHAVEQRFNWERQSDSLLGLYETLIAGRE